MEDSQVKGACAGAKVYTPSGGTLLRACGMAPAQSPLLGVSGVIPGFQTPP